MRTRQRSLYLAVCGLQAVLCLLAGMHPAFAAAFTSTQSGNWNDANTWGGAGIPVSGDTVTLANGFTVTVPVGYTAVCGTSPTSDAGTVALQCASSSGTGILNVNGTLKWQGPVRQANATWTVGAGGTLTYDASGAATPSTAKYFWNIGLASSQANAKLVFNGSSGSRCTVNAVGNVASGGFGNSATNFLDGGRVEAAYTDFSYQGDASNYFVNARLDGSSARLIFDHCTVDHCSTIYTKDLLGPCTFQFNYNRVTNPTNSSFTIQLDGSTAISSGVREIKNNSIAGVLYNVASSPFPDNSFVVLNNVFRKGSFTDTMSLTNWGLAGAVSSWDQNLYAIICDSPADASWVPAGTLTNTYVYRQESLGIGNTHPIYVKPKTKDITLQGWVWEYTGIDDQGDELEISNDSSSAASLTVKNNIFLPNAATVAQGSYAAGSFINNVSGVTQTNLKIYFNHNTCAVSGSTGLVYGVGAEATGTTLPSGAVPSIQSNLTWRPSSGGGLIASSAASATVNNNAVTVADYNSTYNLTGSLYGIPSGQFAATPGAHDISANPQFVDSSRNLLSFDTAYLGHATGTTWVTSTAYVVGDIVSSSDAAFHQGATYNYRCTAAHTSGSTTKPGMGTASAAKWEPASLGYIEDSILAGTTYSSGTNSLIGELVAWVKAGFAPRNSALRNAGHDSVTIGAVEGLFGRNALRAGSAGVVQP